MKYTKEKKDLVLYLIFSLILTFLYLGIIKGGYVKNYYITVNYQICFLIITVTYAIIIGILSSMILVNAPKSRILCLVMDLINSTYLLYGIYIILIIKFNYIDDKLKHLGLFIIIAFSSINMLTLNLKKRLKTINKDYISTAKSLGFNGFKIFFSIKMPVILKKFIIDIEKVTIRMIHSYLVISFISNIGVGSILFNSMKNGDLIDVVFASIGIIVLILFLKTIFSFINKILFIEVERS